MRYPTPLPFLLGILAATLLISVACAGEPEPSPTTQVATPLINATQTPVVAQAPTAKPTLTPTLAAPVPTPNKVPTSAPIKPTPTIEATHVPTKIPIPTPEPEVKTPNNLSIEVLDVVDISESLTTQAQYHSIAFVYGELVSQRYIDNIDRAIAINEEYAAKTLNITGLKERTTIYAYGNLDELFSSYSEVTGASPTSARNHWNDGRSVAISGKAWMFFNTASSWWMSPSTSDEERLKVVLHELFHVYQNDLSYTPTQGANDAVPITGPRWLSEGSAEIYAYLALVGSGLYSNDQANSILKSRANYNQKNLALMETWAGFSASDSLNPYELAALANELLISGTNTLRIINYYESLEKDVLW